jgi:hypothetical protein
MKMPFRWYHAGPERPVANDSFRAQSRSDNKNAPVVFCLCSNGE